jgi:hypothetical protein
MLKVCDVEMVENLKGSYTWMLEQNVSAASVSFGNFAWQQAGRLQHRLCIVYVLEVSVMPCVSAAQMANC